MQKQSLSGLALLQKMIEGALPPATMADTIPMKIIKVEKGMAVFQAQAGPGHLNPMGCVHGGFAATVLDSVTGCAVHTTLGPGESYGTVDLNVKMLKPVPVGKQLRAVGKVVHISRRLGVSEATLTDDEGNLYAHATCSCIINREQKPANLVPMAPPGQGGEAAACRLKLIETQKKCMP